MKKQSGFTMLELVLVIVILGILAATALPKFAKLSGDARASLVKGLVGSMRSANSNIVAKAAIAGSTGATGTVTFNGATINTVYGYAKDAYELSNAMDLSSDFAGASAALKSGDLIIAHTGAATRGATCGVTYAAATSSTPPTYTTTTSGCDQQSSRDSEESDKDKDKDKDNDS